MEALQAQDLEAERLHLQNERSAASTMTPEGADGDGSEPAQEDHAGPPPITHARDLEGPSIQEAIPVDVPPPCLT